MLLHVPLLMHRAWQEHAAELLREYLLHVIAEDPTAVEEHAAASEVLTCLAAQIPEPDLPTDPGALLSEATEEQVTIERLTLALPDSVLAHVPILESLLRTALEQSRSGALMSPPTQPEIVEMREWLCRQMLAQAQHDEPPVPWHADVDTDAVLADGSDLAAQYADLAVVRTPLIATNFDSIIVAASPAALEVLGYADAADLLGRRVIAVVPARYHQAHIAGTTLHTTNGRDNLLRVPLTVPMVRADGTEIIVHIEVRPHRLDEDHCVFVARFTAA